MVFVLVAFDGGIFNGSVHPFDLAICPGVPDFREPMLNIVLTTHVKHVGHVGCSWPIFIARWEIELDAIVSENNVDLVGYGCNEGFHES